MDPWLECARKREAPAQKTRSYCQCRTPASVTGSSPTERKSRNARSCPQKDPLQRLARHQLWGDDRQQRSQRTVCSAHKRCHRCPPQSRVGSSDIGGKRYRWGRRDGGWEGRRLHWESNLNNMPLAVNPVLRWTAVPKGTRNLPAARAVTTGIVCALRRTSTSSLGCFVTTMVPLKWRSVAWHVFSPVAHIGHG